MKIKIKRWVVMISILIAFISMLIGILQYKISKYNSDINKINNRINGKVLSVHSLNFAIIRENLSVQNYIYFKNHDKPQSANKLIDDILNNKIGIIIKYIEMSDIYTDIDKLNEVKEEIKVIVNNSKMTFDDKFKKLEDIFHKNIGLINSYFKKEHLRIESIQNKLGIAYFMQIIGIIALFIMSSAISILIFAMYSNNEAPKDKKSPKKKDKKK